MKKSILLLASVMVISSMAAQNSFKAVVLDSESLEPLSGAAARLAGTTKGALSDNEGSVELTNIPDGSHIITFSYLGYSTLSGEFIFPSAPGTIHRILLEKQSEEIEEIIITSTRGSRTIENIPTRVESISGEELEEKGNMKPGDIRMMLNESTGIQTQQTSATSFNSSIRIQGLEGKYTQLLRDGFPLYSGFSGGLSLLQVVPLDLKQVEVIKGASSTLYGGGAIAGLVNLISRFPGDERELNFMLNGTSALGADISGFYSQKFEKTGATLFASYNYGDPYDPSGTGFTAIPRYNRVTVNPRLFWYPGETTTIYGGFNSTFEDRMGGDILYIEEQGDNLHSYFEKNRTNRFSTQLGFDHESGKSKIAVKNSIGYYQRTITLPDFAFSGLQLSSFSEASYRYTGNLLEWIAGVNYVTDVFNHDDAGVSFDYRHETIGAFLQNTWNTTDKISIESGLRVDHQDDYGFFALPRLSVLFRINNRLSLRAGGGMGYKIPTAFTEDAERYQFRNIIPPDLSVIKAERSAGGNFDLNYGFNLADEIYTSINAMFFYTQVSNPLILESLTPGFHEFLQPDGYIDTKGIETNLRFSFDDFKLFIGYTLADVYQHYNGQMSTYPLVSRHRLNNVLMYEIEEKLKIGLEAYYIGRQRLTDDELGKSYWIFGVMAEKLWDSFSLFINFENITDTRQTRFDTIYTGSITSPEFRDIYAPLDGFVVNGGIKIRLW